MLKMTFINMWSKDKVTFEECHPHLETPKRKKHGDTLTGLSIAEFCREVKKMEATE